MTISLLVHSSLPPSPATSMGEEGDFVSAQHKPVTRRKRQERFNSHGCLFTQQLLYVVANVLNELKQTL
jgi:hypothetical protein